MRALLLLILVASPAPARAGEAVTVRFEDLPRLVAEKNRAVSGAGRLVEAARARTGSLGRSYLPTLGLEAGAERFTTLHHPARTEPYGHAEAKVNLLHGGRDRLDAGVRESQVELASAEGRKTSAGELAAARATYWQLVSDRETVKLVTEALAENEKLLKLAQRRISRGLAAETDRLEFELYGSVLQEERESLTHAAFLLQIRLAAALGMPPTTAITTPETVSHEHDEALLTASFDAAASPDTRALAARAAVLELERKKARGWWAPSLDVYGGYYLYTLRERDSFARRERDDRAVGARLSVPLFDGLRSASDAKALRLQAEGVARQRDQRELAAGAEVLTAQEDLKHDHELVHYAEERIEKGRDYLARTLEEYERGVKNSLDALGAAQRYLGYRRQYAERRRDYQLTKTGLLALMEK